ncbi:MAG: hypothetical protein L6R41_002963 [Letrouitia leprolyta]|nr:MAG: hypothetical protein L6R41_002963 [Letrouitia leprolyta]
MQPSAPPTLDKLPTEIQRQIYFHLLNADCVRRPPDRCSVSSYDFHMPLLRVNRRIHHIAHEVLYHDNRFILVTSDWKVICLAMLLYKVASVHVKRNLMAGFEQHVMRVHVAFARENFKKTRIDPSFLDIYLMLRNELPHLVRLLHMIDLSCGGILCPFRVTLQIQRSGLHTSDLDVQKKLLEPFRRLTSPDMNVNILGCVDAAYAQGLADDMMHPIRWARAVVGQLYSMMKFNFQSAEEALEQGHLSVAFNHYVECKEILNRAHSNNSLINSVQDHGSCVSFSTLVNVCGINLGLLQLRNPDTRVKTEFAKSILDHAERMHQWDSFLLDMIGKSNLYMCQGFAYEALGQYYEARLHFFESIRKDPSNHLARYYHKMTDNQLALNSISEDLVARTFVIGDTPPIRAPLPFYTSSEAISDERYLLQRLSYKGDLLPQISGSRRANTRTMDALLKDLDTRRRSSPAGHKLCVWISSDPLLVHGYRNETAYRPPVPDLSQPEFPPAVDNFGKRGIRPHAGERASRTP